MALIKETIKYSLEGDGEEYLPPSSRKEESETLCCFALKMRDAVKVILAWEIL